MQQQASGRQAGQERCHEGQWRSHTCQACSRPCQESAHAYRCWLAARGKRVGSRGQSRGVLREGSFAEAKKETRPHPPTF
eukprot:1805957-Alexandrium_andersonii.AAC.1